MGRDHPMATIEWIAHRTEGLYDDSSHYTPKRIKALINKVYGIEPSYKKCHKAKEILVERLDGNHDASYQILPAYGQELSRTIEGIQQMYNVVYSIVIYALLYVNVV